MGKRDRSPASGDEASSSKKKKKKSVAVSVRAYADKDKNRKSRTSSLKDAGEEATRGFRGGAAKKKKEMEKEKESRKNKVRHDRTIISLNSDHMSNRGRGRRRPVRSHSGKLNMCLLERYCS